jgi:hypothetical protein
MSRTGEDGRDLVIEGGTYVTFGLLIDWDCTRIVSMSAQDRQEYREKSPPPCRSRCTWTEERG